MINVRFIGWQCDLGRGDILLLILYHFAVSFCPYFGGYHDIVPW